MYYLAGCFLVELQSTFNRYTKNTAKCKLQLTRPRAFVTFVAD